MISFGNRELEECPEAHEGLIVHCGICGGEHPLECTTLSATGEKTTDLMFFRCGDKQYLGAVNGRVVVSIVTRRKDDHRSATC
jgi:hypothetical protein